MEEYTVEPEDSQDERVHQERLAALGQLTATVLHELRNPLSSIQPSLYTIKKNTDPTDEGLQQAIQRVQRSVRRCDQIINELLDYTRITELNGEYVIFDQWLSSVIDDQDIPEIIRVERNFSLHGIQAKIDPDRLRRAVINIMDNAIQAMQEKKPGLNDEKGACLSLKTQLNGERIEIAIADTGIGISKRLSEKIFLPLFSTKPTGIGMGMPTARQIMKQHGGGLEMISEEHKGTVVTLWVPSNPQG